jgi:hypothetical protein
VRQLVHPQQEGLVALVQQAELNLQLLEQQPAQQVPQQVLAQQVLRELAAVAVAALIILISSLVWLKTASHLHRERVQIAPIRKLPQRFKLVFRRSGYLHLEAMAEMAEMVVGLTVEGLRPHLHLLIPE